jgi:Flp pilus assembly secretin CpaC
MPLYQYLTRIAAAAMFTASGPLSAGSEVLRNDFPPKLAATPLTTDVTVKGLRVIVDFAAILYVDGGMTVIAIGNPAIADANLLNERTLLVTGHSAGTTNVIALDDAGRVLADVMVQVSAQKPGTVSVRRGTQVEVHSCISGLCEIAPTGAQPATVAPLTAAAGS